MVQNLDIRCPQGHCSFNNTTSKAQTQEIPAKNFSRPEELKTKDPKSILLRDDLAEPAKKENKQKRFKRWRERTRELKKTLATGNKSVDAAKKKKKCDTSKVMYFNCNKKGHYTSNCIKPEN